MQMTDIYSSENGLVHKYYERNKGTVKYDINKRYTAYVAEELYYPLYQAKNKGFDRSRSIIGLQFNISKKAYVEGYFIYQHELNAYDRTRRDFIYGIGYSREF